MLKLGLRVKFFLYSNTLIVVTMSLVTVLAIFNERQSRYDAIERRGRSISDALAILVTDFLTYEELGVITEAGLIEHYLSEIQANNRDFLLYASVADTGGRITHSSDRNLLGQVVDRAPTRDANDGLSLVEIRDGPETEPVLEIRTPLKTSTKSRGSLTVGFSLKPIERHVRAIAKRAALVAVLLMLGNSALTAVYVETLIRPILGLHQTIRRAARGDLSARARSRASAEVGELAAAFNRMMDELEDAREQEKSRRAQLAHTEKMAAVGTLAAGVAHEVNNPLGGILTCIENMRANLDNRETVKRYLDLIHDGLRRIEHTVTNLLDFSRQRKMVLEPTSINHSLRHVLELVKYQLHQGRIEVRLDLDSEEPTVMADHFQMEQLFLNLVLNAVQSMPNGGALTLRTHGRDGKVVAEVRDTGVGIAEDIRDRIFDPFFTTRGVGEGTGLGLTVSDSIVISHGGIMEVESEPGEGSVFRVSIPALDHGASGEDVE